MQIFVKSAFSKLFTLQGASLHLQSTTSQLLSLICQKVGFEIGGSRITFGGRLVPANTRLTLSDYGISDCSTIELLPRLKGGGNEICVCSNRPHSPIVQIKIQCINGRALALNISSATTISAIKNKLYYQCNILSLEPKNMALMLGSVILDDRKAIRDYNHQKRPSIRLTQAKASLRNLSGIRCDDIPDVFTFETPTAKMPCGHRVGRDSMKGIVKSVLSDKESAVVCPLQDAQGNPCGQTWNFHQCCKIGVFTKEERSQFQACLKHNYLSSRSAQCLRCRKLALKPENGSYRVRCYQCEFIWEFCCLCFMEWRNPESSTNCGNPDCLRSRNYILAGCPTKSFKLSGRVYEVPEIRKCPWCETLISHVTGCKHMKCTGCKKGFCFVCLEKAALGSYRCGASGDYCGHVAQRQTTS